MSYAIETVNGGILHTYLDDGTCVSNTKQHTVHVRSLR